MQTDYQTNAMHTKDVRMQHGHIHPAPEFIGYVDTSILLATLDNCCTQLRQTADEQTIEHIANKLKQWEVIILNSGQEKWWLGGPLFIETAVVKYPLTVRIQRMIEFNERWRIPSYHEFSLKAVHRQPYPLMLPVSAEIKHQIAHDLTPSAVIGMEYVSKLTRQLIARNHRTIGLANIYSAIGIFNKPYGIINQNRIKAWLEDNYYYVKSTSEWTMEIKSLWHLIETASFTDR